MPGFDRSTILNREFYLGNDVTAIAKQLLGKRLITTIDGIRTEGIIVETEAYRGPEDQASHARNGLISKRNRIMYQEGGWSYVYLIYGIYHLFNVVTAQQGLPHAVLIRGVEPLNGLDHMKKRRNLKIDTTRLTAGPGLLTQALGIEVIHSGLDLCSDGSPIRICEWNELTEDQIEMRTRVGVDYAGEWAKKPWRYSIRGNPWVSPAK